MGRIAVTADAPVRSVSLEAVVIRADGTSEDLGEIAYWHRSRWRRFLRKFNRNRRAD